MNNMEGRLGELNSLTDKVMQYEVKITRMATQIQNFDRERG